MSNFDRVTLNVGRVERELKKRAMSCAKLAGRVGITRQRLYRLMRRQRKMERATLNMLARGLGVAPAWLEKASR